ncbi:MAG: type II toxin-antitoxin system VapC family toxin [Planctomycetaceae bacterium]|nr:type II toxin-antitoxin system VapC family toxin [Planctomycetaceae bacterium]
MTWLLDTNACVDYLRAGRGSRIAERLAQSNVDEVTLCSVVKAELLFGAMRSRDAANNVAKVTMFVSRFSSFPFDDSAAEAYGRIRADLTDRGATIGPNDLLIASIAVARGLILVTHNVNEFSRVSNLQIEDWQGS